MTQISIRTITPKDNKMLAKIIRETLTEFKANKPGTVFYDESTDHLCDVFKIDGSIYYVAETEGEILGGAGIYPTENLPEGVCELVKLYLTEKARGQGIGKLLMQKCIAAAIDFGYS